MNPNEEKNIALSSETIELLNKESDTFNQSVKTSGHVGRTSIANPNFVNTCSSDFFDVTLTEVAIHGNATYIYFQFKEKEGWMTGSISMSSKTTITAKNSESFIKLVIQSWGVETQRELDDLDFDTPYLVDANRTYDFYMVFPLIPEGFEYISIRENTGESNEFFWENINIPDFYTTIPFPSFDSIPFPPEPPPSYKEILHIGHYLSGTWSRSDKEKKRFLNRFEIVDEKPRFLDGDEDSFSKWIEEHIEYPEVAINNSVYGKIMLTFVIDVNGSVTDISVLSTEISTEISGVGRTLENEVIRVLSTSPKWTPGYVNGKPVKVRYNFPVIFQL